MRALGRATWWIVAVLLVLGLLRTAWYAAGPPSRDARLAHQSAWLNDAVEGSDAPARMQRLFPEGAVFTLALTALATSARAEAADETERERLTAEVAARNAELRSPATVGGYPRTTGLDHGIFVAGWQLHVQLAQARLSGSQTDARDAVRDAGTIVSALNASSRPFLEAYPGQAWPVDTVVAVAALAEADRAYGVPGAAAAVRRWVELAQASSVDGLLPHHVGVDGHVLDGPRGSSSALTLAFLPRIDPDWSARAWDAFASRFLTRVAGAVGVREFPAGSGRTGDVDSGPLVLGVSMSASAVAVASARAHGDLALADDLLAQADIVGIPVDAFGKRRYALGVLPVGDAFLAWARSVPVGESAPVPTPRTWWWAWLTPWLLGIGVLAGLRRTIVGPWPRRRGGARAAPDVRTPPLTSPDTTTRGP